MANFSISITRPKGSLISNAFLDVAESLSWALVSLGHSAIVRDNWISTAEGDTNIIFGAELLAPGQALPPNCIIYSLEQPSHPMMPKVRALASGLRVWDYSAKNSLEWQKLGFNVKHVPIGYTPNLTRIPQTQKDIDVCFFGWMTPRRADLLRQLMDAGLKVFHSDNCYGGARDNIIARSKVCLNVHHDGRDMFEAVRVSYLLANRCTVVSEISSDDEEYQDLSEGFFRCQYKDMAEVCTGIIKQGTDLGKWAITTFEKRNYAEYVRHALTMVTPSEIVAMRYNEACHQEGDMKDFLPWMAANAKGTVLEIGVRAGHSTAALLSGV